LGENEANLRNSSGEDAESTVEYEMGGDSGNIVINNPTGEAPGLVSDDEDQIETKPVAETKPAPQKQQQASESLVDDPNRVPYFMISNMIISKACYVYMNNYNDNVVPSTFISFYIDELSSYNHLFTDQISHFFQTFYGSKNTETKLILDMFKKAFPTYARRVGKSATGYYILLDSSNKDMEITYDITSSDPDLQQTKSNLTEILDHYSNNDELFSIKELYRSYLVKDELNEYIKKHQRKISATMLQEQKTDLAYTGKATDMLSEKGNVFRLRVPKFKLPLKYPISHEKSLIHRKLDLKRFIDPADTITYLNRHRIVRIREKQSFIDKRKNLLTPQKSKYSSFLDSF